MTKPTLHKSPTHFRKFYPTPYLLNTKSIIYRSNPLFYFTLESIYLHFYTLLSILFNYVLYLSYLAYIVL